MDDQFKVDVPRLCVFIDYEWVPSSDPKEVWERIILEYNGEMDIVKRVSGCMKQQFLSDYYINEMTDLNFNLCESDENLISHHKYNVTINTNTGFVTVEKDFIHTCITEGDAFDMDYCVLTVVYDPYNDKEISSKWLYTIDNMRNNSRSFILTDNQLSMLK